MTNLSLTLTAMNRPELFEQTLNSLRTNDIRGWHVFVGIEPGPDQDQFGDICRRVLPAGSYTLTINPQKLGIRDNPLATITRAFAAGSRFNLCLEEDFQLAPDALDLAKWYVTNHRPHWACLNLLAGTCGSTGNLSDPNHPDLVFESRAFNSIGVGFTRDDWTLARTYWAMPTTRRPAAWFDMRHSGWDWAIYNMVLTHPTLRVIQPVTARCTHLGAMGTNCTPDFQAKAFGGLDLSCTRPPDFALTAVDALPRPVAAHVSSQNDAAFYLAYLLQNTRPKRRTPRAWLSHLNRQIRGRI